MTLDRLQLNDARGLTAWMVRMAEAGERAGLAAQKEARVLEAWSAQVG